MDRSKNFGRDLSASLVVFLVAVPLCLGIAVASEAPPLSGIIAGIIGGIVVGSISRSRLGVSGPAAGLAVIVAEAITGLGFETFLLAVVLAGIMQIVLGALRAGVVAYFFPNAVIKGMLAGIGVIIFLKQIPHAFGWDRDPEGDFAFNQIDGETTWSEIVMAVEHIKPGALIITLVGLALIILFQSGAVKRNKVLQHVPGPLMAVLAGVGLYFAFRHTGWALTPAQTVSIPVPETIDEATSLLTLPKWSAITEGAVWLTAGTIAIVASLETLLCVEATDKLDPQRDITPTNRELLAQGVGNALAGLIGGLPVTQVIVRSSANLQARAASKRSAILHGVWLLLAVLLFPVVMNYVPMASLAAVLLVVGYKLAKPAVFVDQYKRGWSQFAPFVITVVAIYFTDLLTGIGIGLVVATFFLLYANFSTPYFSGKRRHQEGETLVLELSEHVSFLNKARIRQTLGKVADGSSVIVDGRQAVTVDPDVIEVIEDFRLHARDHDIQFEYIPPETTTRREPIMAGEID
jgi:MFS superfamily sulfate permease-like transporter